MPFRRCSIAATFFLAWAHGATAHAQVAETRGADVRRPSGESALHVDDPAIDTPTPMDSPVEDAAPGGPDGAGELPSELTPADAALLEPLGEGDDESSEPGEDPVAEPEEPEPVEPAEPEKNVRVTAIPFAFYLPETSIGFGVGLGVSMRIREPRDPVAKRWFPSNLTLGGVYTLHQQIRMLITPEFYLGGGRYVVEGLTELRYYPDRFYGLGRDTDPHFQTYTDVSARSMITMRVQVSPGVYVGGVVDAGWTSIRDVANEDNAKNERPDTRDDGWLGTGAVQGEQGSQVAGLGAAFVLDRRDYPTMTQSGSFVRVFAVGYPAVGNRGAYGRLGIDARTFYPLASGRVVIGGQWVAMAVSANAPFNHLASMGGAQGFRAFPDGRFRDSFQTYVQGEVRFPVVWRFRAAVMAGVGTVTGPRSQGRSPELLWAAGAGLRIVLIPDRRLCGRADLIFGPEDVRIMAFVHEAF